MAGETKERRRRAAIQRAVQLVIEALDLLDAHGGPVDAAAHLELALQKLRQATESAHKLPKAKDKSG